jgi:hypothetical protein
MQPDKNYLDWLIVTYITQNVGEHVLEREAGDKREKPAIFLERLGWGVRKDYIEDALNA